MPTFGPLLRRTREKRGVSLDDIARETRLSKRYLVALEEEAIAKLPGGTYNRAYLKTYATFLALDPEAVLRQYLAEEERQTAASQQDLLETMNRAIDKRQAQQADAGVLGRVPNWAVAGAAAAVVIGVVGSAAWYGLDRDAAGTLEVGPAALTTPASAATPQPAPAVEIPSPPARLDPPPAVDPPSAPVAGAGGITADTPAVPSPANTPEPPAAAVPATAPETETDDVTRAAAAVGSHLSVSGSGVGTAVVDRQLIGRADRFTAGSRVVFWTHVIGGKAGDTIDHVWLRDGSVVGAASLSVGSPDWRTQSRRVVDPAGDWTVEARDADGRVLARHTFQTSAQ